LGKKPMRISKSDALELIDQKIAQFKNVLTNANYENRYDEAYQLAFDSTEELINQFSSDTAKEFKFITCSFFPGGSSPSRELDEYKEHLRACIAQLKIYKKHILAFWEEDEPAHVSSKETTVSEAKSSQIRCPLCGQTFKSVLEMETHRDLIHYGLHE